MKTKRNHKLTGLFILLFGFVLGCKQPTRNCQDHKIGTYTFDYLLDGKKSSSTFTRTDAYNIDYIGKTIDTSEIKWINDCEFILKKLKPSKLSEAQAIHFKILATTDTSYTFEYKLALKPLNKKWITERGIAFKKE